MKAFLPIVLLLTASAAQAHRPHLQDCQEFAGVARDAAVARDKGDTIEAAEGPVWASQKLHYGGHYQTYKTLVSDVYTQADLKSARPAEVQQAAMRSCQQFNANELATMHDD